MGVLALSGTFMIMLICEVVDLINPHFFIVIDREDRDAQARSLARAYVTQEWVRPRRGGE